jgi:SAM-dependent methyltransferase
MYKEFEQILKNLDAGIHSHDEIQLRKAFEMVPLEIFGKIQIERPAEFPNLMGWLPVMPSVEDQQLWTGNYDHELMRQSVNFVRTTVSKYHEIACKPLNQSTVLDFGCGWGRLIRLLYKYVPVNHIYGVDPWENSIDLCRATKLHGNIFLSDYLPTTLPVPDSIKFDLIIAFSVFTHLSEKSFSMSASVLQEYLCENGILALTIRPREFWEHIYGTTPFFSKIPLTAVLEDHDHDRFAFFPHKKKTFMGEVVYGETSVTLNYLQKAFPGMRIINVEWSEIDPMQIMVFLQKR